jgi:hypothetical protein
MRIKSNLQEAEFEELVRPKLKLFMSVDIVGSTHFKQKERKGPSQSWLNLFISFFTEFPGLLNSEIVGLDSSLPPVRLWKALGDELIFTVELKKRASAVCYIKALISALQKAVHHWHTDPVEPARRELHLKGAAWLVGFPVGNVEIPLVSSSTKEDEGAGTCNDNRDYIGPLVDMGFRLKEYASSRRLVISADLAYLMLVSGIGGDMALFYEGEFPLKGVLSGKPYPVIWIDCDGHPDTPGSSAEMNRLKDGFKGATPANNGSLQKYLMLWLQGVKVCPCVPFIYQDLSKDFKPGPEFEERLRATVDDLKVSFYRENPAAVDQDGSGMVPSEVRSLIEMIQGKTTVRKEAKKRGQKG